MKDVLASGWRFFSSVFYGSHVGSSHLVHHLGAALGTTAPRSVGSAFASATQ